MSESAAPTEGDARKAVTEQVRNEIQKRLDPVPQLKALPEQTRTVVVEQISEVAIAVSHSTWAGQFPPPQILSEYDRIQPGLADRIFRMAEDDLAHTRSMDRQLATYMSRGQIFGFVLALIAIASSVYLILNGERLIGGGIGAAMLISIVTLFVRGNIRVGGSSGSNGEDPQPARHNKPVSPKPNTVRKKQVKRR